MKNVMNYEYAQRRVADLIKTKKEFAQFHQRQVDLATNMQMMKAANGLDLESFLIMPVQRVPRYIMFLEGLLKATPEEHPEVCAFS